jgi:hypothetical protein
MLGDQDVLVPGLSKFFPGILSDRVGSILSRYEDIAQRFSNLLTAAGLSGQLVYDNMDSVLSEMFCRELLKYHEEFPFFSSEPSQEVNFLNQELATIVTRASSAGSVARDLRSHLASLCTIAVKDVRDLAVTELKVATADFKATRGLTLFATGNAATAQAKINVKEAQHTYDVAQLVLKGARPPLVYEGLQERDDAFPLYSKGFTENERLEWARQYKAVADEKISLMDHIRATLARGEDLAPLVAKAEALDLSSRPSLFVSRRGAGVALDAHDTLPRLDAIERRGSAGSTDSLSSGSTARVATPLRGLLASSAVETPSAFAP